MKLQLHWILHIGVDAGLRVNAPFSPILNLTFRVAYYALRHICTNYIYRPVKMVNLYEIFAVLSHLDCHFDSWVCLMASLIPCIVVELRTLVDSLPPSQLLWLAHKLFHFPQYWQGHNLMLSINWLEQEVKVSIAIVLISKEEGKVQKSIQSSTTPDPRQHMGNKTQDIRLLI